MYENRSARLLLLISMLVFARTSWAKVGKFRYSWRDNPATTAVIGWCQESGSAPVLYYSENDNGNNLPKYQYVVQPQRKVVVKGMTTHFVRLTNLKPNTIYYFIVKDSEGQMPRRLCFRTAPNGPHQPLSIIAGGDSRNNRDVRKNANQLVAKIKPHLVLFNGDFTDNSTNIEWQDWFEDWQETISSEGLLFPIVVARGNHEENNETLEQLFDVPSPNIYYGLTFGDNLLRVTTLNSMMPPGGEQAAWLENELDAHARIPWKIVQYHLATRPHNAKKEERLEQYKHWAHLFYKAGVQLVSESDSHVTKTTWPLKPSTGPESTEGFERDDRRGTVYIGEGCWGAPLRRCDDVKSWTRASGSFNHFNWIWLDKSRMDIRVIRVDNAASVVEIPLDKPFSLPKNIDIWNPPTGHTISMKADRGAPAIEDDEGAPALTVRSGFTVEKISAISRDPDVVLRWVSFDELPGVKYEIQRSLDFEPFTSVATIEGKKQKENLYTVLDKAGLIAHKGKLMQYRLKIILPSGQVQFQNFSTDESIQQIELTKQQVLLESGGAIQVKFKLDQAGDVSISLFNDAMKRMRLMDLKGQPAGAQQKTLDPSELPRGKYFLFVKQGSKVVLRQIVMID